MKVGFCLIEAYEGKPKLTPTDGATRGRGEAIVKEQRFDRMFDELNKRVDEAENMEDIKSILHIMVELEAISVRARLRVARWIDGLLRGGRL